ncbi:MAG TPA: DinB family protein [Gemmatimonas sp.]|uniref:DinB family protein n=1 Tax=Gemmatimonas sp. TaxID=1962908 RepID=UPI002ED77FD9
MPTAVLTPAELLAHWQGLRRVTRRVIEAFPEDQLYTFSIGGMRPFAVLTAEMLAIGVPMAKQIVTGEVTQFEEKAPATKAELLAKWDEATTELDALYNQIAPERFGETITLFGQYTGTVWSQFFYAIDNENHHRGQGYVYLRALGIEPPPFWDRQ